MAEYRVVFDPSWRVETCYRGGWRVAYYCSSKEGAEACLKRCEKRAAEWAQMTEEERRTSVLRTDGDPLDSREPGIVSKGVGDAGE